MTFNVNKYRFAYVSTITKSSDGEMIGKFKCLTSLHRKDGSLLGTVLCKGKELPEQLNKIMIVSEGEWNTTSHSLPMLEIFNFSTEDRADYFEHPMYCKHKKTIYYNNDGDNGFTIARYEILNNFFNPDGDRIESITILGNYLPTESTFDITFESGKWEKNKYGEWQIKAISFITDLPDDEAGIVKYLSSLSGCGQKTAEKLAKKFKEDIYRILEFEPEIIAKLPRMTMRKVTKMQSEHLLKKPAREIIQFLGSYGVAPNKSINIYKYYFNTQKKTTSEIMHIIKTRPFSITKINGFGFRTADNIARAMGLPAKSNDRLRSAVIYQLEQELVEGHLYINRKSLISKVSKLLNLSPYPKEKDVYISDEDVENIVNQMIMNKEIIREAKDEIYLLESWDAEESVSKEVNRLLSNNDKKFEDFTKSRISYLVNKEIEKSGFKAAEKQAAAAKKSLTSNLSIITGGPGTGKTTITKIILSVFENLIPDAKIVLCAPTGRAAQRMYESTGYSAKTIHRLLGIGMVSTESSSLSLEKTANDKLTNELDDADLLIVDESSMIDIHLMKALLCKIKNDTKVIFIGDADQLPSVGPGAVFKDFIKSKEIPFTVLDKVFRQEGDNIIAENAINIKNGILTPKVDNENFCFYENSESSSSERIILKCYEDEYLELGSTENVQVLLPTRKELIPTDSNGNKDFDSIKNRCNATTINRDLQNLINPLDHCKDFYFNGKYEKEITIAAGETARINSKVMQIKNNYDFGVFNGDIGFIKDIYFDEDDDCLCAKIFFLGYDEPVMYKKENFKELSLAYATTVHKSQGSEYDTVIIGLLGEHYKMLKRNIIYTAITRAKKKVIIVGSNKFYTIAVSTEDSDKRRSHLTNRIVMYANGITPPNRRKDVCVNDLEIK